jgi:hypothetical protein
VDADGHGLRILLGDRSGLLHGLGLRRGLVPRTVWPPLSPAQPSFFFTTSILFMPVGLPAGAPDSFRLQEVAITPEVEASQLRFGLADEVALREQDLVVEPPHRLACAPVAPADDRSARAAGAQRQRLEGEHLDDRAVGYVVIVRAHGSSFG